MSNSKLIIRKLYKGLLIKTFTMKFNIILILLCSVFITTSCSQPKSEKDNDKNSTTENSTNEEDFNSFLENFNNKPTFQRKRVLFPLEATLVDPSEYDMKTINEVIKYQDWLLLNFAYDSTFATRQMDGYEQNIRLYNDSSIIEHRGIDNGIFANYYFTKINGKWFLKSFTDVSY